MEMMDLDCESPGRDGVIMGAGTADTIGAIHTKTSPPSSITKSQAGSSRLRALSYQSCNGPCR